MLAAPPLVRWALRCSARGNSDKAEALAQEALANDPGNPEAQTILRAVAKKRGDPDALNLVGDAAAAPADLAPLATAGAFVNEVGATNKAFQEMVEGETRNIIDQARRNLETDPDGSIYNLKQQIERIRQITTMDPDRTDQLLDMLQAAVRQAQNRKVDYRAAKPGAARANCHRPRTGVHPQRN